MVDTPLSTLEMARDTISKLLRRDGHESTPTPTPTGEIDWQIYTYGLNGVDNHENYLLRY